MGQATTIEWTDATWNPTEGCSMAKGSEKGGCLNCYAARQALRRPAAGLAVMRDSGPRWTGKVQLVESRLTAPLHWKQPKRIFVNSMSDLWHETLRADDQADVYAIMQVAYWHTFQVLTKRPENRLDQFSDSAFRREVEVRARLLQKTLPRSYAVVLDSRGFEWPLRNVWEGVSAENRATLHRIDTLRKTPAAVRFVSAEPLLEDLGTLNLTGLDQIIIGGESGPGARAFDIAWARNIIAQCKASGVAAFFKQAGALPYDTHPRGGVFPLILQNRKGGDPSEWAEDLRVRQYPGFASAVTPA